MADNRYRKNASSVYSLKYHIVWCTKYRRPVLTGNVADDLKRLLFDKAKEISLNIIALEVMPDHVHIFVEADPTDAPHRIVNQFKRYTSRILRNKYKSLRTRIPSLWTRSYYIGSVGQVSEQTVQKYIEAQKGK